MPQESNTTLTPDRSEFPVVGIGASAGGLAVFEAFFSAMPESDTGIAFVLVQHLAPDHKSLLVELISHYTKMRVFEVKDGMKVEPDCAYIIPPGRDMVFINGTLQLLEPAAPRGQRMAIDFFFQSLAQDLRDRAIGIILSGSCTDGTLGIRAIKAEGGMVMAQSPSSAEFDGMPRSAISTGLVDFELTPSEMPAVLIAYITRVFGKLRRPPVALEAFPQNTLNKIFVLLRAQTRHDFSQYKSATIQRRIERRLALHQIATLEDYTEYLRQTPAEIDALFRDLLIGVTNFFRDPEAFASLEKNIIPRLFSHKPPGAVIRVWVPGCSTGDEAYSIAILLDEYIESAKQNFKIQIFATDIDGQAIASARSGVFPASIARDISQERLRRYFSDGIDSGSLHISKKIRDMVVFSEQDLVRDPPFSKLDLISCRNLLIYMDAELQKRIIPLFHYALNPDGFLFLGTSEGIGEFTDLFSPLDRKLKTFQRKSPPHQVRFSTLGQDMPTLATFAAPQRAKSILSANARTTLRTLTEKMLLLHFSPVAALVTTQGDILYLHGRSGHYLEPQAGESAVSNIFKMAREGLREQLTITLRQAIESKEIIRRTGLLVKTNGDFTATNLTIRPMPPDAYHSPLYIVILEKAVTTGDSEDKKTEAQTATAESQSDTAASIAALRKELRAKEEYLEASNEELATANEELKSSNEEMQSINEELQSTNEELNTSQEELQSVNEELATVNAELQNKISDLSRVNNDLNNLLAGTSIGTIFVDHELRIVRFTPAVTQIINLIDSDVGRPVSHIASNLINYHNLVADVTAVLNTLVPAEQDVQIVKGSWYTMRIIPYRTLENMIQGAVITFVDITAMKTAQETLRISEERIRVALLTAPVTVFNQDKALRYTWVHATNPALRPEQVLGKTDAELFSAADAELITGLKQRVLDTGIGLRQRIHSVAAQNPHVYDLTVEPLRNAAGEVIGITSATIDISAPVTP